MDDNIYSWILLLYIILLHSVTVNAYQLKPVVLPEDVKNTRIFTDVELAQYDASDVCRQPHILGEVHKRLGGWLRL